VEFAALDRMREFNENIRLEVTERVVKLAEQIPLPNPCISFEEALPAAHAGTRLSPTPILGRERVQNLLGPLQILGNTLNYNDKLVGVGCFTGVMW